MAWETGSEISPPGGDTAAVFAAEALHHARALVELSQTGSEVGGVALFTGHLFQTAGHLTQSLGPAGGGVSQNCHVITHVAEVLGDGDAGVDGRLTGGHGHIGGVCNQDGALHQRLAVAGVFEFGELHQNVGHLIAALAAADVDHDVHVGPLGKLVLHDRLARAEGAVGDGEEGVDDTLAGVHGARGNKLSRVGALDTHGPALHHGEGALALVGLDLGHDLIDRIFTLLNDPGHFALDAVGDHDLVQDGAGLLDSAQHIAGADLIAGLCHGDKLPFLAAVQGRHVGASRDAVAAHGAHLGQRALNTVIDIVQHAGSKLDGHGHTGGLDRGAGAQAGGFLVDLDGGGVAGHIQDLADQALRAHAHNVGDVGVCQALGHDKRSGYLGNCSAHYFPPSARHLQSASGNFVYGREISLPECWCRRRVPPRRAGLADRGRRSPRGPGSE